jgi:hypothetical protein
VAYLRWHEGGDGELAPSLLQKPRGRRPKGADTGQEAAAAHDEAQAAGAERGDAWEPAQGSAEAPSGAEA